MGTLALMGAGKGAPGGGLIADYLVIAGCYVWYEASKESYSDTDPVGSMTDWSTQANTATQGTAAAKPTFRTGEQNGKPAFDFDGGDSLTKTSATGIGAGAFTWVGVLKRAGTGSRRTVLYAGYPTGQGRQILIDSSEKLRLTKSQVAEIAPSSASVSNSAYELWGLTYNGTTYTFYRNGAQDSTGSASQSFTDTTPVVHAGLNGGGSEPMAGKVALQVMYDTVLSGADLAKVFARANTDYAVY